MLPSHCVCNAPCNISHALSCPTGGIPSIRHNELRDSLASLMDEVSSDVTIKPELQPLANEGFAGRTTSRDDGARREIAATGFWGCGSQRAFFDVRVFNPCAQSFRFLTLKSAYLCNEQEKTRKYQQRVCEIEHRSLMPLVFTTAGGMGKAATVFIKRLANKIARKHQEPYSGTIDWLRTIISLALLRLAFSALRGTRKLGIRPFQLPSVMLATHEGRVHRT